MSLSRVVILINKGDDFEQKLRDFFYWSGKILNHPGGKPEKRKVSYLKNIKEE